MGLGHSPAIISEGLVFYFDPINTRSYAGTGLTGYNLIDTSIVGSLVGGAVYDVANKGSIYFDGVDDRISFSFNSALDISQSITIEAYIKPQSYPTAGGGGMILTKVISYYLEFGSNGKIRVYFDGLNSPGYHESVNTVPLNKWTHVAVTRDSSNSTINIYINGILDRTVSSITGNITVQQTHSLTMGGYNGSGYLFIGLITCGKIYNRALSSTEILQNYNATKKRFSPEENIITNGLVLNLDAGNPSSYAGTGNTAFSVAGIGYTAILVNGPTFTSTSGGGFVFDGTNDYINIPTTTGLDSTSVSWSFWYRSSSDTAQALISKGSPTFFKLTVGPSTVTLTNELITIIGEDNGNRVGYISTNRNELFDNNWHNIVFTAQSSFYKLYLDGRDLSLTVGAGNNNGSTTNAGSSFFIGTNSTSEYVNGNISQVQIYNKALSSTEILQNYNALKGRYGLS